MPLIGDLGIVEILILVIIVIIIFYPQRMRDIVKNFGVAVKAFKEGAKEVEKELNEEESRSTGGRKGGKSR